MAGSAETFAVGEAAIKMRQIPKKQKQANAKAFFMETPYLSGPDLKKITKIIP
ncbi:MAG TPA: hypothetical protein VK468_10670 [Pyrinomonadaceae bacterium]|nr:hypothetical protein [Pyrinomonadaceae bacterium]